MKAKGIKDKEKKATSLINIRKRGRKAWVENKTKTATRKMENGDDKQEGRRDK